MSSRRGRKRKGCTGKIKYDTMELAVKALHSLHCEELHQYRCVFCGKWHLGHRPDYVRRIIAERKRF